MGQPRNRRDYSQVPPRGLLVPDFARMCGV